MWEGMHFKEWSAFIFSLLAFIISCFTLARNKRTENRQIEAEARQIEADKRQVAGERRGRLEGLRQKRQSALNSVLSLESLHRIERGRWKQIKKQFEEYSATDVIARIDDLINMSDTTLRDIDYTNAAIQSVIIDENTENFDEQDNKLDDLNFVISRFNNKDVFEIKIEENFEVFLGILEQLRNREKR